MWNQKMHMSFGEGEGVPPPPSLRFMLVTTKVASPLLLVIVCMQQVTAGVGGACYRLLQPVISCYSL